MPLIQGGPRTGRDAALGGAAGRIWTVATRDYISLCELLLVCPLLRGVVALLPVPLLPLPPSCWPRS